MRWHELFADLEGEARALEARDRDAEIIERIRYERGQVGLVDRLRSQVGRVVTLELTGAPVVQGRLDQIGDGWLLVSGRTETVVLTPAVRAVVDLPRGAVSPDSVSRVECRLSVRTVLRAVAADRALVVAASRDGCTWTGTPDVVGADHLELAVHDTDVAPRASAVRRRVTIPFTALAVVSRADNGDAWLVPE